MQPSGSMLNAMTRGQAAYDGKASLQQILYFFVNLDKSESEVGQRLVLLPINNKNCNNNSSGSLCC